jgi:hypothetical protein
MITRISLVIYLWLSVGDGLLVTLCHHREDLAAAIGEAFSAHDWGAGVHGYAFGSQQGVSPAGPARGPPSSGSGCRNAAGGDKLS